MAEITIETARPSDFDDIQAVFAEGGDARSCQCLWWLLTGREFEALSRDQKRETFRDEIEHGPPPGVLAYVDGAPAGWARVGPRPAQPRLSRTRRYAATTEPWDAPDVWAVSCFVVRKPFRGQGLNAHLLAAAVSFAREHGARVVEGYPIDPTARQTPVNDLYHGVASTFADAGFVEIARPTPHVVLMQLRV